MTWQSLSLNAVEMDMVIATSSATGTFSYGRSLSPAPFLTQQRIRTKWDAVTPKSSKEGHSGFTRVLSTEYCPGLYCCRHRYSGDRQNPYRLSAWAEEVHSTKKIMVPVAVQVSSHLDDNLTSVLPLSAVDARKYRTVIKKPFITGYGGHVRIRHPSTSFLTRSLTRNSHASGGRWPRAVGIRDEGAPGYGGVPDRGMVKRVTASKLEKRSMIHGVEGRAISKCSGFTVGTLINVNLKKKVPHGVNIKEPRGSLKCGVVYRHGREGWVEETGWSDDGDDGMDEVYFDDIEIDGGGGRKKRVGERGRKDGGEREKGYVAVDGGEHLHEDEEWEQEDVSYGHSRVDKEKLSTLLFGDGGLMFLAALFIGWLRRAAKVLNTYLSSHLPPSVPPSVTSFIVNGSFLLGALWLSKSLSQIVLTFGLLICAAMVIVRLSRSVRTASRRQNRGDEDDGMDQPEGGEEGWRVRRDGKVKGGRTSTRGRSEAVDNDTRKELRHDYMMGLDEIRERVIRGFWNDLKGVDWSMGQGQEQNGRRGNGEGEGEDEEEWDFDSTRRRRKGDGGRDTRERRGYAY